MRRGRIALLAGAVLAIAIPAAAQEDQAATANAAFVRGANSGITPQTKGEETDCFVSWTLWRLAIEERLVGEDLHDRLPQDLQMAAATVKSQRWAERVRAGQGKDGLKTALETEPRVRTQIEDAIAGDTAKLRNLVETLAICRNPDVSR
jgi:hypothetical protein